MTILDEFDSSEPPQRSESRTTGAMDAVATIVTEIESRGDDRPTKPLFLVALNSVRRNIDRKKKMLEQRIRQEASRKRIFAFESNGATSAMLKKKGIRSRRIRCPEDIPTREQILSGEAISWKGPCKTQEILVKKIREGIRQRYRLAKRRRRLRERLVKVAGVTMKEATEMSPIEVDGKTVSY